MSACGGVRDARGILHPDTMIAGVARTLDAPVVTTDDGFERVDGLDVENPRKRY